MLDAAPEADEVDLETAIDLREVIYSLVAARHAAEPLPAADVAELNRHAAGLPVKAQLGPDGVMHTGSVSQGLAALARETVEILGGDEGALLRECARPECTQVYLDRSRGHRREWCAMRTCGNRVKAAAYRARQSAAPRSDGRLARPDSRGVVRLVVLPQAVRSRSRCGCAG
ncbi:CGNR zinc finger domain-containing protein [Streptomyces sp. NPDC005480]|uniref:CGNR zinc finger domain-containing protein n=1 Tax=Streptomyces sp. NPDC005480 TaxID=3154880 RepID=UPI0033A70604